MHTQHMKARGTLMGRTPCAPTFCEILVARTPCASTVRERKRTVAPCRETDVTVAQGRGGDRTVALAWRVAWPLAALLTLGPGCFVFVSTGPSHIEDATIVFVVTDDRGEFVAHVHIEVTAIASTWRTDGRTHFDGAFHCRVQGSVDRVRVGVTPPDGYALVQSDGWPRTLLVGAGGEDIIEVRVRRLRPD